MEKQEVRTNWKAYISLENLTQEQVNTLTVYLVDKVEELGGFMGGGFVPEENEDEQDHR